MPRSWNLLLDQIDDELISSLPMELMMASQAMTPFFVTAQARGSSFHRTQTVERPNAQASCQRDDHIASIQIDGRLIWQASTGYGKRALIEAAMGRYKGIISPRLRARSFLAQQTEAAIGVAILNRMFACGRPKSVRCQASTGATK